MPVGGATEGFTTLAARCARTVSAATRELTGDGDTAADIATFVRTVEVGELPAHIRATPLLHPSRPLTTGLDGSGEGTSAVLDALEGGHLLREAPQWAVDEVERVLATGIPDEASRRIIGVGVNRTRHAVRLVDEFDPAVTIRAVPKEAAAQAMQDDLGWGVLKLLGAHHLGLPVGRTPTGEIRIAFGAGDNAKAVGVHSWGDIERVIASGYRADTSLGLDDLDAARAARIDRQILQFVDYLLANRDRHWNNVRVDTDRQTVRAIDWGHIGAGDLFGPDPLRPIGATSFTDAAGLSFRLDPEVAAFIRARLSPDALRALHAEMITAHRAAPIPARDDLAVLQRFVQSERFINGVLDRYEHVLGGRTAMMPSSSAIAPTTRVVPAGTATVPDAGVTERMPSYLRAAAGEPTPTFG